MAYKTILLAGSRNVQEALAAAAITPGHMLEIDSAGKFKKHATAGGVGYGLWALEDDIQGNDIDDDYSTGNVVTAQAAVPGDQIYAWIANGENIAIGDKLISNGDGTLKEHTADSSGVIVEEHVVAVAREACDMSDSSGADPTGRCRIQVV